MTFEDNNRSGGQQASREIVELVFAVVAVDHYKPARLLTGRAGQRLLVRLTFRGDAKEAMLAAVKISKMQNVGSRADSMAYQWAPNSGGVMIIRIEEN